MNCIRNLIWGQMLPTPATEKSNIRLRRGHEQFLIHLKRGSSEPSFITAIADMLNVIFWDIIQRKISIIFKSLKLTQIFNLNEDYWVRKIHFIQSYSLILWFKLQYDEYSCSLYYARKPSGFCISNEAKCQILPFTTRHFIREFIFAHVRQCFWARRYTIVGKA